MKLDERTFGDSLAAITMARIINEKGLNPRINPSGLINTTCAEYLMIFYFF